MAGAQREAKHLSRDLEVGGEVGVRVAPLDCVGDLGPEHVVHHTDAISVVPKPGQQVFDTRGVVFGVYLLHLLVRHLGQPGEHLRDIGAHVGVGPIEHAQIAFELARGLQDGLHDVAGGAGDGGHLVLRQRLGL